MWLPYMSHFISNYVLGVCNLYEFKLACSATETLNLGIDNYEHLSTALAKHHANGDTSMVTEIVNLCPIM